MGAKQLLQRQLYDRRVHGQPHQVGDLVWLHTTVLARGNTKKLHHPWKGPYLVLKRLTDSTYKIQLLSNPREHAVVHFNRLKPCTTATAEQPSALDHVGPPPGDGNSTKDTPQAAPIGTHLEIIEPMEPHVQEQQLPSPPSLVQTVLVGGIQLAVDSLQIVLVSSSRFEIVCRIRDVFFQRGELCNVVQCCNFHNCYVCVCTFAMLSSIHPY